MGCATFKGDCLMHDLLIGFLMGYTTMVLMYLFFKYMGDDKNEH